MATEYRIGHGYDLHRLAPVSHGEQGGRPIRPLVLGGVPVQGHGVAGVMMGVLAHSDGDVLLHAVTDALLGALCMPDIGQLFPDSAPENAGRRSSDFLAEAFRRVQAAGWRINNLDATVVLEKPKISPIKDEIRQRLASLLNVRVDDVNIKGKTHEGVDGLGEGLAIEAHAVVLLAREA